MLCTPPPPPLTTIEEPRPPFWPNMDEDAANVARADDADGRAEAAAVPGRNVAAERRPARGRGRPKTGAAAGGNYCVAVGCSNCQHREGKQGVKFHKFPQNQERRKQWIIKVNRLQPDGTLWTPQLSYSRLCSEHFVGGKKSNDPNSPSHIPTIFPTRHVRSKTDLARQERCKRREVEAAERRETILTEESMKAAEEEEQAGDDAPGGDFEVLPEDDVDMIPFLVTFEEKSTQTFSYLNKVAVKQGLSTKSEHLIGTVMSGIDGMLVAKDGLKMTFQCHYISANEKCCAIITESSKSGPRKADKACQAKVVTTKDASTNQRLARIPILALQDKQFSAFCGISKSIFEFFLHRIGQNLTESRSNVSSKNVRKWFEEGFWALYSATKDLVIWLNRETIKARLPASFRGLFPSTRAIIDASEVECSRPPTPRARVLLYSQYKSRWTYKFLIACAPSGKLYVHQHLMYIQLINMELLQNPAGCPLLYRPS